MYKPANIREFVTPAIFLKCNTEVINGRTSKTYEKAEKPNLRGKFKLKGTSQVTANGLVVIADKTTFVTWYRKDFESGDALEIDGVLYKIVGTPEDTENRHRYSVLNLERLTGGA